MSQSELKLAFGTGQSMGVFQYQSPTQQDECRPVSVNQLIVSAARIAREMIDRLSISVGLYGSVLFWAPQTLDFDRIERNLRLG